MNPSEPAGRIRIALRSRPLQAVPDDAAGWVGGEASVGTQARRHLRSQGRKGSTLAFTVLGLTFLGGLAVGCLLRSWLPQTRR